MIQSAPFYWITCDQPGGCTSRIPCEDDETIAWSEENQAVAVAQDSEWLVVDGKHYCDEHRADHEQEPE